MVPQVMQFAAFSCKAVPSGGEEALSLGLPFDELAILQEMRAVLETELCLAVVILAAEGEAAPDPGAKKAGATPGKPAFYPHSA